MKKVLLILLLNSILGLSRAQDAIKFGLNAVYFDSTLNKLLSSKNEKIVDFPGNYHVQYLRFPGGLLARNYFWDRQDLIPQSFQLYSDFLSKNIKENTDLKKNNAKVDYYSNRADEAGMPLLGNDLYASFLKFCKKESIMPIIQLNCWYYHDGDKVYKIPNADFTNVEKDKWPAILDNIKKQVEFTHKYLSQVYWEIGNEDQHVFSPNLYASIAAKYAAIIKSIYPNDKVIVTYSNVESKKVDEDWNVDMISCLAKANSINFIDFVAPHFYRVFEEEVHSQLDLQKRIQKVDVYAKWRDMQKAIENYPNIKVFYTEFGIFKKVGHPNYNTQMQGLLMFYYLMNFNATPNLYGVILHSFTSRNTATFYDENSFNSLKYGFNPSDEQPNNFFKYIPPQAKAIKLFYTYNTSKAQSLVLNSEYAYTVTSGNGKIVINILNYSDHAVNIKLNEIVGGSTSVSGNLIKYQFDDLDSHQWNYNTNTSQSVVNSKPVELQKRSYNVITLNK